MRAHSPESGGWGCLRGLRGGFGALWRLQHITVQGQSVATKPNLFCNMMTSAQRKTQRKEREVCGPQKQVKASRPAFASLVSVSVCDNIAGEAQRNPEQNPTVREQQAKGTVTALDTRQKQGQVDLTLELPVLLA